MNLRRLIAAATLCLLALVSVSAPAASPNWLATVTVTPEGSHILGNPKAPVRLTAWISYTCPHCAEFEKVSDAPLRLGYVAQGKVAYEIKHILRDPVDATVAQLVSCGPKERFFGNHSMFFRRQSAWIGTLANSSAAQRERWQTGDYAARRRAIASDFHFYEIMEQRGYRRTDVDRCLGDNALAERLAAQTAEAVRIGFQGTPSFSLGGVPLFGTYSWQELQPQLRGLL